jgi:hypothetical protein
MTLNLLLCTQGAAAEELGQPGQVHVPPPCPAHLHAAQPPCRRRRLLRRCVSGLQELPAGLIRGLCRRAGRRLVHHRALLGGGGRLLSPLQQEPAQMDVSHVAHGLKRLHPAHSPRASTDSCCPAPRTTSACPRPYPQRVLHARHLAASHALRLGQRAAQRCQLGLQGTGRGTGHGVGRHGRPLVG